MARTKKAKVTKLATKKNLKLLKGRRANSTNKDKTKNASEMHPVVLRRSSRKHKPVTSLIKSGYVMEKKKKTKKTKDQSNLPNKKDNKVTKMLDLNFTCSVPGCVYSPYHLEGTVKTKPKAIALFTPSSIKNVIEWNSVLGLGLTVKSKVCELHFKSKDIGCCEIYITGTGIRKIKSLKGDAVPIIGEEYERNLKRSRNDISNKGVSMKKSRNTADISKTVSAFNGLPEDKINEMIENDPSTSNFNSIIDLSVKPTNPLLNVTPNDSTTNNSLSSLVQILENTTLVSTEKEIIDLTTSDSAANVVTEIIDNALERTNTPQSNDLQLTLNTAGDNSLLLNSSIAQNKDTSIIQSDEGNDNQVLISAPLESDPIKDFLCDSKNAVLPNQFWISFYNSNENTAVFLKRDESMNPIKTIIFYNSFVPKINIHSKPYEYKTMIKTNFDLNNLLEAIDGVKICWGFHGFFNEICVGYIQNLERYELCPNCQNNKDSVATNDAIQIRTDKIKILNDKIAEMRLILADLRKTMSH